MTPPVAPAREAWITGIGLASSLGIGSDAHWEALQQRRVNTDTEGYKPFVVHPMAPVSFDAQIPKKGDQRQMEAWQRIGTYAAGLAVDSGILNAQAAGNAAPGLLNERLMGDLRPTLFLAQLSNLLAGNIAIVHGVTGSSRTFMGEEAAGVDALRIALARINAGQSDIALVGAAHNGERKDLLMLYEFGDFNLKNEWRPVWDRGGQSGFALGSLGVFLVLESRAHAEARGAKPLAKLGRVVADHARRTREGAVTDTLAGLWQALGPVHGQRAIISGATGAEPATAEERRFLAAHRDVPVRATGTGFGHALEAQFPLGVALAALALSRGALFPPNDTTGTEIEASGRPDQIVVVGTGHWRGEGMALVEAVD